AGMMATRADPLAMKVGDAVDAGFGPHHELGIDGVERLPEIDPLVAARPVPVGRDVVAAHELDLPARHQAMGIALGDLEIVIDIEAMFGPRAGFSDHMQKIEMSRGAIRERYLVDIAHAAFDLPGAFFGVCDQGCLS